MENSTKKIIKKTNPSQFRILVESMDEFPELATSSPIFGKNKCDLETKWDDVAQKINAAGPPLRSGSEWKKVSDMGGYEMQNKSKNIRKCEKMKGTGGGPSYEILLTDLERDIDRICQLSKAAAPGGLTFGTNSCTNMEVPFVFELTSPKRSSIVDVVTPTRGQCSIQHAALLSSKEPSPDAATTTQAQSNPISVMSKPNDCEKLSAQKTSKKRKMENNVVESQEVKLLKLQVEQNNALVDQMKVQTKSLDSMADSFRGIEVTMKKILNFLKDE